MHPPHEDDKARDEQHKQRRRDHPLPRQSHELVVPEPRQRPANSHRETDHGKGLAHDDGELKQDHAHAARHWKIKPP